MASAGHSIAVDYEGSSSLVLLSRVLIRCSHHVAFLDPRKKSPNLLFAVVLLRFHSVGALHSEREREIASVHDNVWLADD